ncbi:ABC1 kinase family protein [Desulfofustis glycolicus]|uniref:2-octaprenylphenol hydroxylase n=1 Tax=Desulfofustis glycolicus DSM 9705 TaxID=1121409 RepID=A0A1M5UWK3_9BACT|nr:AarF/UbiB family protein [Desulfofustis glycolicus]MCB2215900.1 AarF/ABC1/UbiB kinase family protein [Desulfobulbaceae bacterium]SHH67314.1 2-octaprenylphenol hydroxylase [Desulfofustis glycolicus DSM 9705]
MKITSLRKTFKNTKRLAEIIKVLSQFGFREVVTETGLHRILGKTREDIEADRQPHYEQLSRPVRARMVLEQLGPSFIKIGQILSTRPDLIPPEWASEFSLLQEKVSPVAFSDIEHVLAEEFPGRLETLFTVIDEEPLAAASLAQVHRARLTSGEEVVIKVLKPGNRQRVEDDVSLLETMAQLVESYFSDLGYSPIEVAQEFSRELLREVNFIQEAQATERLHRYFEDDPDICFPKVYWQATTRNALTLEEIKGRSLSMLDPTLLKPELRRTIVANATKAVFKQCLKFGFFHADPHPGNIFLLDGGRLCFIDCGTTGHLDKKTAEQLVDLVAGVIKGDVPKLCRVVIELTDVDPQVTDRRDFRVDLQHLIDQVQATPLKHIDIAELLGDFFTMLQRYKIRCPSDLLLLVKALSTIEGVAAEIDPTFDVLSHVEPEIEEVVTNRYGVGAIRKRLQKSMTDYLLLLEDMPGDIQRFLDHARHNRFTLNLELMRIEHLGEKIDQASRLMGMAMIIAALIVGSSILLLADRISQQQGFIGHLGMIGLIFAALYSAGFVASFLLPKKKNK